MRKTKKRLIISGILGMVLMFALVLSNFIGLYPSRQAKAAETADDQGEVDLKISLTISPNPSSGGLKLGDAVTVTATLLNGGTIIDATGVCVEFDISKHWRIDHTETDTGVFSDSVWTIDCLDAGKLATLDITATVTSYTDESDPKDVITFSGSVKCNETDKYLSNNSDAIEPFTLPGKYPLWIGGVQVTKENCNKEDENHWTYAPDSHTLTLYSLVLAMPEDSENPVIKYTGEADLTISLNGESVITPVKYNGIVSTNSESTLSIVGDGSLTIKALDNWKYYYDIAIDCAGPVVINCKKMLISEEYAITYGIQTNSSVTVGKNVESLKIETYQSVIEGLLKNEIDASGYFKKYQWGSVYDKDYIAKSPEEARQLEHTYKKIAFPMVKDFPLVYDPGENATGEMEGRNVDDGEMFVFPECKFQSNDRTKGFDYWEMTGVDGIFYVGKDTEISANCLLGGVITVTAHWKVLPPATIDKDCVAILDLYYNGSDQALVFDGVAKDGEMNYVVGTDADTVPKSGWSWRVPKKKEAGTYYVWYKAAGNYSEHCDSEAKCVTVTIKPLTVTASVADLDDVTYNGSEQKGNDNVLFSGLVSGHSAKITYSPASGDATGTYDNGSFDKDSFHAVDKYDRDVTKNYKLDIDNSTCGKLTITQSEVKVIADAKSKIFGREDPELTYTATGLFGDDSISGSLEREAGNGIGTYEITQGTLSAGKDYYITFTGATFTIVEEDYLKELRAMLQSAIARGGEQTVTWAKGTSLPNDIMKTLEDHPQITLIFKYSYEGKGYTVTLSGKYVKAWKNIPWFGPLYLFGNYGKYDAGTVSSGQETGIYVVKRGDNLTKIARELKVTVAYLVQMNQIKNPNLIWARQVLRY